MIYAADIVLPITTPPVEDGAVLVRHGRIVEVGGRRALIAKHPDEELTDFSSAILMPGLVNLHGHLECASFGSLAEPSPFPQWLGRIIRASREMGRDDWLRAARHGVARSLEAGITCTADITRSGAGLQAAAEVGMPALVYLEVVGVDDATLTEAVVRLLETIKSAEIIAKAGDLTLGLSPHSAYSLSTSALSACAEIASEYELPLSIHLAETEAEVELVRYGTGPLASTIGERLALELIAAGGSGASPAQYLDGLGLVRDSLVVAHGVWLDGADISLLKERGACIAACPTSNELLQVGEAPVAKFVEHGLRLGIGTDSLASNPDLDLFVELRKLRALYEKQTGLTPDSGSALSAQRLVEMVTIDAAAALGFGDVLGSIEPGKRADFISIEATGFTSSDPYMFVVDQAAKAAITHTVLGGDIACRRP